MRPLLALAPFALILAACQPQAPDGAAAPAPADAPAKMITPAPESHARNMDLSQPIRAVGTEPFWAVEIDGTKLTLKRPGEPDKLFEAPGAQITPGQARWQAKAADGQLLSVSLFVSDCSDGMSDLRYPMSAEVTILDKTQHGCAAKVAEFPREGG